MINGASVSRIEEHCRKINAAKKELQYAGPCHKRDLMKYIRRMEKEVATYERYQKRATRLANQRSTVT